MEGALKWISRGSGIKSDKMFWLLSNCFYLDKWERWNVGRSAIKLNTSFYALRFCTFISSYLIESNGNTKQNNCVKDWYSNTTCVKRMKNVFQRPIRGSGIKSDKMFWLLSNCFYLDKWERWNVERSAIKLNTSFYALRFCTFISSYLIESNGNTKQNNCVKDWYSNTTCVKRMKNVFQRPIFWSQLF